MSGDAAPEVSALAINVTIPEELRWTDTRRGEEFMLTTLNPGQRAVGRPPGSGLISSPVNEYPYSGAWRPPGAG